MGKVVISSDLIKPSSFWKIMGIIFCLIVLFSMSGVVTVAMILGLLLMLFVVIGAVIYGYSNTVLHPFKIVFDAHEVVVGGYNGNKDYVSHKFNYLEFSKVTLDVSKTLTIATGSGRILSEVLMHGAKKAQIEQVLREFQKHGKTVRLDEALYGLYSIDEG